MIAFAHSVPDAWNEHQTLAGTSKGLAIHALNLDVDIGPYLQTQKLMDSVVFARRKGIAETLTAAELRSSREGVAVDRHTDDKLRPRLVYTAALPRSGDVAIV